jgi:hypothetical protein
MGFCQYKDIFGKPGQGIHSIRIFGFAAVDLVATIAIAILITFIIPIPKSAYSFYIKTFIGCLVLVALLLLSIAIHKMFCVETKLVHLYSNIWT